MVVMLRATLGRLPWTFLLCDCISASYYTDGDDIEKKLEMSARLFLCFFIPAALTAVLKDLFLGCRGICFAVPIFALDPFGIGVTRRDISIAWPVFPFRALSFAASLSIRLFISGAGLRVPLDLVVGFVRSTLSSI